jgi:hypothetical protein
VPSDEIGTYRNPRHQENDKKRDKRCALRPSLLWCGAGQGGPDTRSYWFAALWNVRHGDLNPLCGLRDRDQRSGYRTNRPEWAHG